MLVLLTTAIATACATPAEPRQPTPPASSSPTPPPTSPAPPTTPPPPPPPVAPPPLPVAKDGTNLRACLDGTCEVLITKPATVRFNGKHGVGSLHVEVTPEGVDFSGATSSGTIVRASQQRPDQGGPSTINKLTLLVVALRGTEAVVRFAPS
ncbi:hypothetical protein JOF53_002071 [Crossiella equi]|uniref:Uncharacterized protein n=1 Tax=Crossiella equi TaxID=130796 RepID=A0ABS5AAH0_9PSEU|nr:hypothetical protein [Crossiella equi]MBP2473199.1 hypothetical protein [Crossiella equi]